MREPGSSGRQIQYHPGGGHHGDEPYWKFSSGETGKMRSPHLGGPSSCALVTNKCMLNDGIKEIKKGTAEHWMGDDSWTGWIIDLFNPVSDYATLLEVAGPPLMDAMDKSKPGRNWDIDCYGGIMGSW